MSDLKACPFCGRIPDIEDCGEHRWFIRCKCGIAQDKLFFQKCDAVRAWNKRKELRVKDTNVPITDTISRQLAIELVDWYQHEFCECDYAFGELANELSKLPYAQTTQPNTLEALDCISIQEAIDALEKVANFFPWKVPGKSDTYDRYNEGWNDAIGRAEMEIETLPLCRKENE